MTYQDAEGSGKEGRCTCLSEYAVLDTPPATPENTEPGFGTDVTRTLSRCGRTWQSVLSWARSGRRTSIPNDILSHELTAAGARR